MAYRTEDPAIHSRTTEAVVDYHDRVHWGAIISGLVVAIASQLVLSALGSAIGLTVGANGADARDVGAGVGIWSIISLLISLFIGGWLMAQMCGPMNNRTALLNGAILWATTLALSAWLLTAGVSGAFGIIAANAGEVVNQVQQPGGADLPNQDPNITAQNLQDLAANSAKAAWSFLLGSLFGLAAAIIGSSVGARKPRVRV